MDKSKIKLFVETHPSLVKMRESTKYPGLYVLKYSKKVFYDDLWNEYIEHCRGTVIDKDFNVVSYPFTKIYNYGIEKLSPNLSPDTMVTAYRKVNGFMASVTYHNDDLLVSTTGSLESEYVDMVYELLDKDKFIKHCKFFHNHTWLFECVHKNDPHIIPEIEGLYLLGWRKKEWGSVVEHDPLYLENYSKDLGVRTVESIETDIETLQKIVKNCKHEGYVFYTTDGISAKIKSPYYLTSKWVARNPRTDKLVDMKNDIKKNVDEEYYTLIDHLRNNIDEYTLMDEQSRLSYVRSFLEK